MSLPKVQASMFIPFNYAKIPNFQTSLQQKIPQFSFYKRNWKEQSIKQIDCLDARLEKIMPDFFIQTKIDEWAKYIKSYFSPCYEFNKWLNSNGEGNWQILLATFLAKLPLRSARNIFHALYQIVETTLYTTVHPVKSISYIARNLILMIGELEKPETWAQIGAGSTGALIGQAWITGTSCSVIGIGVGAAISITGLSLASLQASLKEQKGLLKLTSECVNLSEAFFTGALMGILTGAVQKRLKEGYLEKKQEKSLKNQSKASLSLMKNERIDQFIKQNNLPPYSKLMLDHNGNQILLWDTPEALLYFAEKHPKFFQGANLSDFCPIDVSISLNDSIPCMKFRYSYTVYTYDGYDPWIYTETVSRTKWLRKYSSMN